MNPGINQQIFEINLQDYNKNILESNLYYKLEEPKQHKEGWSYKLIPVDKPKNLKNVIKLILE